MSMCEKCRQFMAHQANCQESAREEITNAVNACNCGLVMRAVAQGRKGLNYIRQKAKQKLAACLALVQ